MVWLWVVGGLEMGHTVVPVRPGPSGSARPLCCSGSRTDASPVKRIYPSALFTHNVSCGVAVTPRKIIVVSFTETPYLFISF